MVKVRDFLETLIGPDRLKIVKGEQVLYLGYKGCMQYSSFPEEYLDAEMVSFRAEPEIRHKKWKEKGLAAPLEPGQMAEFQFSDLEMKLYYKICI